MADAPAQTQPAVKYEVVVQDDGRIEVTVPFAPGKRVVVFVIQQASEDEPFGDLVAAAQSSIDFWDNAFDDEDWNDA